MDERFGSEAAPFCLANTTVIRSMTGVPEELTHGTQPPPIPKAQPTKLSSRRRVVLCVAVLVKRAMGSHPDIRHFARYSTQMSNVGMRPHCLNPNLLVLALAVSFTPHLLPKPTPQPTSMGSAQKTTASLSIDHRSFYIDHWRPQSRPRDRRRRRGSINDR